MIKPPRPYRLRPLRLADLPSLMVIELKAFPVPWKASAYEYEITQNRLAHYQALTAQERDRRARLVGYAGFWMLADEAHISTIAVDPARLRRGLGELLLLNLLRLAFQQQARMSTLEVRTSNTAAQSLYAKYRFQIVGRRRRYYQGKEDALIMTVEPLDRAYKAFLRAQETALFRRLELDLAKTATEGG